MDRMNWCADCDRCVPMNIWRGNWNPHTKTCMDCEEEDNKRIARQIEFDFFLTPKWKQLGIDLELLRKKLNKVWK